MNTLHNLYGCLGYFLFFAVLWQGLIRTQQWLRCPSFKNQTLAQFIINSVGVFLYGVLVLWGIFYLRGFFSDLSVVSTSLLFIRLVRKDSDILYAKFLPLMLISGPSIFLYLSTLGLLNLDLYSYGYHSRALFGVSLSLIAILLICQQWRMSLLLLLALTVSSLGITASPNLWDALLDPFLALFCIFLLLRKAYTRVTLHHSLNR